MQRRTVLRRGLGAAALSLTLAGCSGGDSGGDSNGSDGGTNGNESSGPSSTGASGKNRKIELFPQGVKDNVTVTALKEVKATDKRLEVKVTLRNDSDRKVRMDHYAISLTGFTTKSVPKENNDRAEARVDAMVGIEYNSSEQKPTPPGETVTLGYSLKVRSDSNQKIKSYLVTVACGGAYDPPGCG